MTITLTFDDTLSRVVITGSDLPDGFVRVERSVNEILWTTVRGGGNVRIEDGSFQIFDYEFAACVENFYRVQPSVVETLTVASDDQEDGDDYMVPLGVGSLTFESWGGGGRGQGLTPPSATNSARPGGGGGSYSRSDIAVTPGETLKVRVGEGGHAGGQLSDDDGASSFVKRATNTLLEAVAGTGAAGFTTPGAGGDAAFNIGQIRQSGGDGGDRESVTGAGGGGGGSAFRSSGAAPGDPGLMGIGGDGGDGHADGGTGGAQEPGLRLPGFGGPPASTPDDPSLDITGDLDLRALVATDDFTPIDPGVLVAKWDAAGDQRSYLLRVSTSGALAFLWSSDGTVINTIGSTDTISPSLSVVAVRVEFDVDDGAGNNVVTFFTAPASSTALDAGPWTQLGDPVVTAGVASVFASTAILEVGSLDTGGDQHFEGIIHAVQVRDGIDGTLVADPRFHQEATDTVSFVDAPGRTWMIVDPARIINESTAGGKGAAPGAGGGGQGNNQVFQPGTANGGDGATGQVNVHSWFGFPFDTAGLSLPGEAGSFASTPDAAPLDITGDLDLRAELTPDTWNPTGNQAFLTKWDTTGDQRSYYFRVDPGGGLSFLWSPDGSTINTVPSTVDPVPGEDGRLAVRVTIDVASALMQHVVTFWTAPSLDGPWTQLGGQFVGGGNTSIFDSAADLVVSGRNDGMVDQFAGVVHGVQVLDGIDGTEVANPDFDAQAPGTTMFTDAAGREWTLHGDAEIEGAATFESSITPVLEEVWLKSIKYPFLNRPVDCPNYGDVGRAFRGGVFDVQGRSMPIAVTDLKGSRTWQMTVLTHSLAEARDMDLILAANQVMFIHPPCEDLDGCGPVSAVPGGYVVIGETVQSRGIPGSRTRIWTLPLREVVQPSAEVIPATMTWGTVLRLYGSWEALIASNPTWIDLFQNVGSPDDLVVI